MQRLRCLLEMVPHCQNWLLSSQTQLRPQLLLGSRYLMLVQHLLGWPLPLRTLHWLRQLQVCIAQSALPTACILRCVW